MSLGYISQKGNIIISSSRSNIIVENSKHRTIYETPFWKFVLRSIIVVPIALIVVTALNLDSSKSVWIPVGISAIMILTGIVNWVRTMLSMNLFSIDFRNFARFADMYYFIISQMCYIATSYATMNRNWPIQFCSALMGATINWIAFITLFNGDFAPPTKQQLYALMNILLVSLMAEGRVHLMTMYLNE